MEKALLPGQDAAFNQVHPRAPAGTGGAYRPGQFTPKSQAEIQQEEAEDFEGEAQSTGGGAASQTVALGPDTKVAMAADHARQRRVAEAIEAPATPSEESQPAGQRAGIRQAMRKALDPTLVVLFSRRADATKFAIACDQVIGADSHTKVAADANGRYHVEPAGLSAHEIAHVQDQLASGVSLSEIGREPAGPERGAVVPAAPFRAVLRKTLAAAGARPAAAGERRALFQACLTLAGDAGLAALETAQYGSIAGLIKALSAECPDTVARAGEVAALLLKGKRE